MCDVERKSRECCRVCWSDEKVSIGRNEQKKNFQYPYSSCFCIVLVLIVLAAAESRVTEWPLFAIATDCRCRYGKREGEREKESFVSLLYSLYYLFFYHLACAMRIQTASVLTTIGEREQRENERYCAYIQLIREREDRGKSCNQSQIWTRGGERPSCTFRCLLLFLCLFGTQLVNTTVGRYSRPPLTIVLYILDRESKKKSRDIQRRRTERERENDLFDKKNGGRLEQLYVDTQLTYNYRKKNERKAENRSWLSMIRNLLWFFSCRCKRERVRANVEGIARRSVIIRQIKFRSHQKMVVYPRRCISCLHSFRNTHTHTR